MQSQTLLSFFLSDKSNEPEKTPHDSVRREEQRTEETLRESGHEEEVTTLNETIEDYRFDDKDDGVLFPLSGPGIDKDKA